MDVWGGERSGRVNSRRRAMSEVGVERRPMLPKYSEQDGEQKERGRREKGVGAVGRAVHSKHLA